MIKVGVTGGIGSGKSTVCRVLTALGYPVFHADLEARAITNADTEVVAQITLLLGDQAYIGGALNRPFVAEKVFASTTLLAGLNAIVHPAVERHFEQWCQQHSSHKLVFEEAAVLFESGAHKRMDYVVAVVADVEQRLKRVTKRDDATEQMVLDRMKNQLSADELIARSSFVVKNNDTDMVLPQVFTLLENLLGSKAMY
ncbi:MAG: dephospho-CoA kinase [Bacteroidales bacterium]|nr:dephospho-CoA kinase [Bacteroidales bacterium]MBN2748748.1 dephospho-CoA kinase [Bacteroidales bacterium]